MRLYIHCPYCDKKIFLTSDAKTRYELALQWGHQFNINCPHCHKQSFHSVQHVFAEASPNNASTGAILGGLIGLIFGPEGALIGSAIGGAGGLAKDNEEKNNVQRFNESFA